MKPPPGENETPPQGDAKWGEGTRKAPRRLSPAGERHKGCLMSLPAVTTTSPKSWARDEALPVLARPLKSVRADVGQLATAAEIRAGDKAVLALDEELRTHRHPVLGLGAGRARQRVHLEAHAAFGVERQDAAVRIAAS